MITGPSQIALTKIILYGNLRSCRSQWVRSRPTDEHIPASFISAQSSETATPTPGTFYTYEIETTEEQDGALIRALNTRPNHSHFSFVWRNCADFARCIINFYYPAPYIATLSPIWA